MTTKILLIVIGALSLITAYLFLDNRHQRRVAFDNALARDSVEAANDTTRTLNVHLADSLRAVTLRSVQLQLERDELDKASHMTSTSRTNIGTHVETVHGTATAPAHVPEIAPHSLVTPDVRRATFNVRRVPFTMHADVAIPPIGDASLSYDIGLDDAAINVRTTCGATVRGVRQASVLLTSPDWLHLDIASSEQSRDVCNASNAEKKRARRWGIGGTIGYGGVISRDATSNAITFHHGIGGTVGLSFRF